MVCLTAMRLSLARGLIAIVLLVATAAPALADSRAQAKRLHDRLVGVPPSPATLDAMEALMATDPIAAANIAMSDPLFYSSALKNFATPWTNVARTAFADLNDYTATVIGIARDDRPFTDVLTADLVYVAGSGVSVAPYSQTDNLHYQQLEAMRADLSNPTVLVPVTQSSRAGTQLPAAATAGVLTTRAGAEAFFSAGTNRRMWRFTAINYLCKDMEQLNGIGRPADWIRQDVTRSPGGDSRIFHNTCVGCHSGMDPLASAFAYYEWDSNAMRLIYTPGQVQGKYLINSTVFPGGHITRDDSWRNQWRYGQNSYMGWRAANGGVGNGAKSLGEEVVRSRAFSECQVAKVFERVCLRPPSDDADRAEVTRIADIFELNNEYRLKRVFAETAVFCMGE